MKNETKCKQHQLRTPPTSFIQSHQPLVPAAQKPSPVGPGQTAHRNSLWPSTVAKQHTFTSRDQTT